MPIMQVKATHLMHLAAIAASSHAPTALFNPAPPDSCHSTVDGAAMLRLCLVADPFNWMESVECGSRWSETGKADASDPLRYLPVFYR